jgi:hypothetical protein
MGLTSRGLTVAISSNVVPPNHFYPVGELGRPSEHSSAAVSAGWRVASEGWQDCQRAGSEGTDRGHDLGHDAEMAEVIEDDQVRARYELGGVMGVDDVNWLADAAKG